MKLANFPRQRFNMDIFLGLPNVEGHSSVIAFSDDFSLFTVLIANKSKEAKNLLQHFKTRIFSIFNIAELHSDNEKGLQSNLFRDFCTNNNIALTHTAPRSPFQNSVVEKLESFVRTAIRIYTHQYNISWLEALPHINLALNSRLLNTQHTPEEIFFGNVIQKHEILQRNIDFNNIDSYTEYFLRHVKNLREDHMRKRLQLSAGPRNCRNKHTRDYQFQIGDLVYLSDFTIADITGSSTRIRFLGPFEIIDIYEGTNTCNLLNIINFKTRIAHLRHLKPSVGPVVQTIVPANFDRRLILQDSDSTSTVGREIPTHPELIRRSKRIAQIQKH
jgi:hypothetical protein